LKDNSNWVFKDFQKRNGTLSSDWLENNEKRLAESDWDNLYLPSIFFGFFTRTGNCFIRICGKENLLDYQLLKAEVLDIQKNESIYKLIVADDFRIR
jgi:hypothetical protein